MAARYEVGQRVWVYDVNSRGQGPIETTITKVGRTLVHIVGRYGRPESYRIETGARNDDYQHQWIRTDEERAELEADAEARARLAGLGVRFDRAYSTAVMARVADLLELDGGTS